MGAKVLLAPPLELLSRLPTPCAFPTPMGRSEFFLFAHTIRYLLLATSNDHYNLPYRTVTATKQSVILVSKTVND